jgi:TetR/AcrR family transcriptional regulator, regulator of cefoperazone and chloramphenicol sensitivity
MPEVCLPRTATSAAMAAKPEHIRDAAMKCFAERGFASTSLRTIADVAGVSLGQIQHYFATRQRLIESIDAHVLAIFARALHPSSTESDRDRVVAAGEQFAQLMSENPAVMDYVGRSLSEGGQVGAVIFDGLYRISEQQGRGFIAAGLAAEGLDPVWSVLLPLILRVGTVILRPHIERHLGGDLYNPDATSQWDVAVTRLIREGQLK